MSHISDTRRVLRSLVTQWFATSFLRSFFVYKKIKTVKIFKNSKYLHSNFGSLQGTVPTVRAYGLRYHGSTVREYTMI